MKSCALQLKTPWRFFLRHQFEWSAAAGEDRARQHRAFTKMSDPAATRGWLEDILLVLVEPGTGLKLVPIINCALVALICVLAITLLAVKSVHLIVMLVLAICLMASINWFVHELRKEDGVRDKAD